MPPSIKDLKAFKSTGTGTGGTGATVDLKPIIDRLTAIETALAAIKAPDLKPLSDRLDAIEAVPAVNLKPLGDRLAVLETQGTKLDDIISTAIAKSNKTIEDALQNLVDNEAVDDAELETLKALVAGIKVPDITGKADQTELDKLKARLDNLVIPDLKPLTDRLKTLEDYRVLDRNAIDNIDGVVGDQLYAIETVNATQTTNIDKLTADLKAAIDRVTKLEGLLVVSDLEPDDTAWKFWLQRARNYEEWTEQFCFWIRNGVDEAIRLYCTQAEAMPDPTFADAVLGADGRYTIRLPGSAAIGFNTGRASELLQISFSAGTYKSIALYYLDAGNQPMRQGTRAETIQPTETVKGLGRADAPGGAIAVRIALGRADGSSVTFEFPLV